MKIHRNIHHVALVCFLAGVSIAQAIDPAAGQITRLRSQREKATADAIAKANSDYANDLDRLKAFYGNRGQAVMALN